MIDCAAYGWEMSGFWESKSSLEINVAWDMSDQKIFFAGKFDILVLLYVWVAVAHFYDLDFFITFIFIPILGSEVIVLSLLDAIGHT